MKRQSYVCSFPLVLFILALGGSVSGQNAPISTLGTVATYGSIVQVAITVTNFNNIGSCNLKFVYDPSVALATSITKNPSLPGFLNTNVTEPGTANLGWFTFPGVTLPDGTEVFTITFDKVDAGSTAIAWDDDGFSCAWSDGNLEYLNDIPTEDYYINGSLVFQENSAPIVLAPSLATAPQSQVAVPIRVMDFNTIGSLHLTLITNTSEMDYQSFVNTSGFPGLTVTESPPGTLVLSGSITPGNPGISLTDGAVLASLLFDFNENPTGLTWFDNGESCQFTNAQFTILDDTPQSEHYIDGSIAGAVELEVKAFLEGPYEDIEMHTLLNDQDLLPAAQPYSTPPWNYPGQEFSDNPPEHAVDWVLVELREWDGDPGSATPDKTIARKAGFIMKNGQVKAMDGTSNLSLPVSLAENIYLVLHHRNHLSIMSAETVPLEYGVCTFDFSADENNTYGGSESLTEVSPGIWGLVSGDDNADGSVDSLDKTEGWKPMAGKSGYLSGDYNLDGESDNPDKNKWWLNNLNKSSAVP